MLEKRHRRVKQFHRHLLGGNNDLFFDETPTVDSIKDLLNLFALLNTLMLGIVLSFLTSVDNDVVDFADNKFRSPAEGNASNGYHEFFLDDPDVRFNSSNSVSALVAELNLICTLYLFASLVIAVFIYLDLVNKSFDADTTRRGEVLLYEWWKVVRWGLLVALFASVIGTSLSMAAVVPMVYILYPDYRVEQDGKSYFDINSPYGYAHNTVNLNFYVLFCMVALCSMGTGFSYFQRKNYDFVSERNKNCELMVRSRAQWEAFFDQSSIKEYFSDYKDEYVDILVDARLDYEDRRSISDQHLESIGMLLPGHRVKLLTL
mmetsp:Transcript_29574/g.49488  ORF Transcript_29574/g.49488 Transcript_29574/m.49488 type:complete len:318 (-) Transcript_29574:628-1581(-)